MINCPNHTILINNSCTCPSSCETCDNNVCNSCKAEYVYFNNSCINQCPDGYFNSFGVCLACEQNCSICTGLNHCYECKSPYYLYSNSCYFECPGNTYANEQKCIDCKYPCLYCDKNSENCTLCRSPLLLFNNSCVFQCPSNYSAYFSECIENSLLCAPNCTKDLLNNDRCEEVCNVKACNFDNNQCPGTNYSNSLDFSMLPCPISITTGLGLTATGTSFIVFQSSITAVGSSFSSIFEGTGIIALLATVGNTKGTHGRVMLDLEDNSVKTVFFLLLVISFFHVFGNLAFTVIFYRWIVTKNPGLQK